MTLAERVAERLRDEGRSIHTGHDVRVAWTAEQGRDTAAWLTALADLVLAAAANERCIVDMTGQAYGNLHENDFDVVAFRQALRRLADALGIEDSNERGTR